jgi:uncharacterized protein (DUF1697 family)
MQKKTAKQMAKFAAFLRGINVGGHKKVPMADLKKVLEKIGFQNVKTLLNSGNIVFEGEKELINYIPKTLEKTFGFSIETIILPFDKIENIVKSAPFKKIKVTPKIRSYVTFLKEETNSKLKIPYKAEDNSFQIIKLEDNSIFSVVDLDVKGTLDAMSFLEKEFGKNITTRNYNTIMKLVNI